MLAWENEKLEYDDGPSTPSTPPVEVMPSAELIDRMPELVRRERTAAAELIANLVEIDRRKLYLEPFGGPQECGDFQWRPYEHRVLARRGLVGLGLREGDAQRALSELRGERDIRANGELLRAAVQRLTVFSQRKA